MRIAIINQPLSNRGDESAHRAFVYRMANALSNDTIDVILCEDNYLLVDAIKVKCKNVNYIRIPKGILYHRIQKYVFLTNTFPISYLYPTFYKFHRLLSCYDKVVCAPGGICLGGFMSWNHLWQLTLAKRLGKPIYYWGRSIGPFTEESRARKIFKKHSYEMLNYFSYISLRDSKSIAIAKKIGIECDQIVDSAFLTDIKIEIPESIKNKIGQNEFITFVPNELTWHYRYRSVDKSKIDNFYLKILDLIGAKYPQYKIVMLPQTYQSVINDCAYFEYLKQKSENQNIIVVDENQSSDIQQALIKKSKLVIGARYHSIVFALNNETPFIALSYEHKIKGLLETLNYTNRMIEIQDIFDDGKDGEYAVALAKVKELLNEDAFVIHNNEAKDIVNKGFESFIKCITNGNKE